ncbi:MAG: hypothetical protein QXS20_08290 [Candidatus Thorarchaeota archaeon]
MSETVKMPWSFYSTLISFGVFFFCLNVFIFTRGTEHPLAGPWMIIGIFVGLAGLIFSWRMVRIHQRELIERKRSREATATTTSS